VLYQSNVIMEYLDERFPHPPLLPVYPVARAESRLLIYRIERDWCRLANLILRSKDDSVVAQAQQELKDGLIAISPILAEKDYFMSEDFTLVDCFIAPILWRLSQLGITLPSQQAGPMLSYMARLFERDSFQESLSETEQEMHL
jgi:RNA polymerase-associated protein